ncbi:MAG: hypothetical protein AB1458_16065 [Bacteroidota bacterium]
MGSGQLAVGSGRWAVAVWSLHSEFTLKDFIR